MLEQERRRPTPNPSQREGSLYSLAAERRQWVILLIKLYAVIMMYVVKIDVSVASPSLFTYMSVACLSKLPSLWEGVGWAFFLWEGLGVGLYLFCNLIIVAALRRAADEVAEEARQEELGA